jgi:hypothetical protein
MRTQRSGLNFMARLALTKPIVQAPMAGVSHSEACSGGFQRRRVRVVGHWRNEPQARRCMLRPKSRVFSGTGLNGPGRGPRSRATCRRESSQKLYIARRRTLSPGCSIFCQKLPSQQKAIFDARTGMICSDAPRLSASFYTSHRPKTRQDIMARSSLRFLGCGTLITSPASVLCGVR